MTDFKPGDVVVLIKEYTFAGKHYPDRMDVGDEGVVVDPEEWGGADGLTEDYKGTIPVRWGESEDIANYPDYKGFWTDPDCIQLVMPTEDEVQEVIESIKAAASRE